jgi:nitrogen regulatory protein P-II 1
VLCPDELIEAICEAMVSAYSTGQIGDGLVWVITVAHVHRIRNREPMI